MELIWIDDFLTLATTRNFSKAAALRHTTQSAFSRRIQRLEEWLGAELFLRTERPLHLTLAGDDFLLRAARLREDMLSARRAARSALSHFEKSHRIYTTNTLASHFITAWLRQNPIKNYSLIVASISDCLEALKRGNAQSTILPLFEDQGLPPDIKQKIVGQDRLILVENKKTKQPTVLDKKVIHGPVMAYTPGTAYGAQITALLTKHKIVIEEEPLCESASAEALCAQVKAGMGSAWIPECLIQDKDIVRCPLPPGLDIPYDIVHMSAIKA